MVLVDDGKNRLRDLINDDIYQGQVGTDSTAATASDTALGSAVAGTNKSLTLTKSDKHIQIDYTILSTEGNTNTLKEYGINQNTGTDFLMRQTFNDLVKDNSKELLISTQLYII